MKLKRIVYAAFCIVLLFIALACSKGGVLSTPGHRDSINTSKGGSIGDSGVEVPREIDTAAVRAEIQRLGVPEGVEPDLYAILTDRLIADLERAKSGGVSQTELFSPDISLRFTRNPDLTSTFRWTYYNPGDGDLSGDVGIPDITPIAIYYLGIIGDGVNDHIEPFIDGDSSLEIGISDITPIANNYLRLYNVDIGIFVQPPDFDWNETQWQDAAVFTASGGVSDTGETGFVMNRDTENVADYGSLEVVIPDSTFYNVTQNLLYFAVRDRNTPDIFGSYEMFSLSGAQTPPEIDRVIPIDGDVGDAVTFQAFLTAGATPITFDWDFGGGATPNTSQEDSPHVVLGPAGMFEASVTATNEFGSDTYTWQLAVAQPPDVTELFFVPSVPGAYPNRPASFSAAVTGTTPIAYEWSFGGGATPSVSTDKIPTVQLGATGDYTVTLTATNRFGSDSMELPYTVLPPGDKPNITGVSPITGVTGTDVTFTPVYTGFLPITFTWDFGGGASPNTAIGERPTVTLGNTGSYTCSVVASNIFGNKTYPFNILVATPIVIDSVTPLLGYTGYQTQFSASFSGGITPYTYSWDFGGGASPSTYTLASPLVTLSDTPGSYNCMLTISDRCSSTDFPFTTLVNVIDPSRILDLTLEPAGPITAGDSVTINGTIKNGDGLLIYEPDFDIMLNINTPYGTLDQTPGDTKARIVEMDDNGDGTYSYNLQIDVAGTYNFFGWAYNSNGGYKESGVFDQESITVFPAAMEEVETDHGLIHRGAWIFAHDGSGNSWTAPSVDNITYESTQPIIAALAPVIDGELLYGGFTATDYGISVLKYQYSGGVNPVQQLAVFSPIEPYVVNTDGLEGGGVQSDSFFDVMVNVKTPEGLATSWRHLEFDMSWPTSAPFMFNEPGSGSSDPDCVVTFDPFSLPGVQHVAVTADWVGAGDPPGVVPINVNCVADPIGNPSSTELAISTDIVFQDSLGQDIDWHKELFNPAFLKTTVTVKPLKTLNMHAYIVQGEAAPADVQTDVDKAEDFFNAAAAQCSVGFFVSFTLETTSIPLGHWSNIDQHGDGLDRYDANEDGVYDDPGEWNDLANAVTNEPPYYDADPDSENVYYVPAISGGVIGACYFPNGQIAVANALDADNLTLAHEKVHEMDLRVDGDFDVLDGLLFDKNGRRIWMDGDADAQGAYRAGNIMNYNDTGENVTSEQGQHLVP